MRPRVKIILSLAVIGCSILLIPLVISQPPRLLYNPSESAKIGLYRIDPVTAFQRGDLVAAYLPSDVEKLAASRHYLPDGIPVIKTIWAVSGDEICIKDEMLLVPEQPPLRLLRSDRQGRSMPVWLSDCLTLQDNQVLLISDLTPYSFDSRYFGPVETKNIIGKAVWLGTKISLSGWQMGGARGLGAECKIKGPGTNGSLTPCLHIPFYSSIGNIAALRFGQFLNDDHRMGWFHRLLSDNPPHADPQ